MPPKSSLKPRALPSKIPSLREERRLLRAGHQLVAAIDEVGRGALAGPVSVGIVVVDLETKSAPSGVRDSKLLTPQARQLIAPKLRRWAPQHAVGHASPEEIDRIGIIAALRLAACRALARLPVRPDCALLDGNHNWLSLPIRPEPPPPPPPALFDWDAPEPPPLGQRDVSHHEIRAEVVPATVVTQIKADMRCAAVAAASVLAKVERDAIMVDLAGSYPQYGWELNKGYSAPDHIAALRRLGPSALHRRSWNLPGLGDEGMIDQLDLIDLTDATGMDASEFVGSEDFPEPRELVDADEPASS
jgi:ribonuclease HII